MFVGFHCFFSFRNKISISTPAIVRTRSTTEATVLERDDGTGTKAEIGPRRLALSASRWLRLRGGPEMGTAGHRRRRRRLSGGACDAAFCSSWTSYCPSFAWRSSSGPVPPRPNRCWSSRCENVFWNAYQHWNSGERRVRFEMPTVVFQ